MPKDPRVARTRHHSLTNVVRLTTAAVEPTLDQATVSRSAFDWLCEHSARLRARGAALVREAGREWLRLDSYVGVVETPCGTVLEILPKHASAGADVSSARRLLKRMLSSALDLPHRNAGPASVEVFESRLDEWIMTRFLLALDRLVKRGLRFDYQRVEEERLVLRGRLATERQMRQPAARQHYFHIQHDVFEPDGPENRLLRSALDRIRLTTGHPENWRLARELGEYLASIPRSGVIAEDFRRWRGDRLMAHYRDIRPWCELVLSVSTPLAVSGAWNGISLLFPMEQVFERYVADHLRTQVAPGAKVVTQAATEYLCQHQRDRLFKLRPDIMIRHGAHAWVLDTKWKLLDSSLSNPTDKYGLSQADFYQLFAYGMRYLGGRGELYLVYPLTSEFVAPLSSFELSPDLRVWVVPFDLEQARLLVEGCGDLESSLLPLVSLAGVSSGSPVGAVG